MTDTRDMKDIAKLNHLADALGAVALEHYKAFHEELNKQSIDPARMMEWGERLYSVAAQWKFCCRMADMCRGMFNNRTKEGKPVDYTMSELKYSAAEYFRPRGRHHSSSVSSNNMGAHMDEVALEFILDHSAWRCQWFSKAQQQDPEYQEWWQADMDERRAADAVKAAELAQLAKDKEAARNRVRAAMKRGDRPYSGDLLLGWPNLADLGSVRSNELRILIQGAHKERQD